MRAAHFNFLVLWIKIEEYDAKNIWRLMTIIFYVILFIFFLINLQSNSNIKCKGQKIMYNVYTDYI